MKPFFSQAVRAKEIVAVLARHGFADLLEQLDLPDGFWRRLVPQARVHRSQWERIRLALEDLGPAFIKFGQLLSMRPDVLPHGLILELRKLQDAVRPMPFAEIRPVLLEELPAGLADLFSEFDETAVASASLAQVYRARLRADGRVVAVKVLRPDSARLVQTDLGFAVWLATQIHQRSARPCGPTTCRRSSRRCGRPCCASSISATWRAIRNTSTRSTPMRASSLRPWWTS